MSDWRALVQRYAGPTPVDRGFCRVLPKPIRQNPAKLSGGNTGVFDHGEVLPVLPVLPAAPKKPFQRPTYLPQVVFPVAGTLQRVAVSAPDPTSARQNRQNRQNLGSPSEGALIDWINANPPSGEGVGPDAVVCACCLRELGQVGRDAVPLADRAWVHHGCYDGWLLRRRMAAQAALACDIVEPSIDEAVNDQVT